MNEIDDDIKDLNHIEMEKENELKDKDNEMLVDDEDINRDNGDSFNNSEEIYDENNRRLSGRQVRPTIHKFSDNVSSSSSIKNERPRLASYAGSTIRPDENNYENINDDEYNDIMKPSSTYNNNIKIWGNSEAFTELKLFFLKRLEEVIVDYGGSVELVKGMKVQISLLTTGLGAGTIDLVYNTADNKKKFKTRLEIAIFLNLATTSRSIKGNKYYVNC
jgi:hypothetical protein